MIHFLHENGAFSTEYAVKVTNKQMDRLNLLSRRPRAFQEKPKRGKVTPTSQYFQQKNTPIKPSAKVVGKTHR